MVPLDAAPPGSGEESPSSGTAAADQPRSRRATMSRRAGPFVAGVAAAFVALLLYAVAFPQPKPLTPADVDQQVQNALASQELPPPDSQFVYQQIAPSLVFVQTELPDAGGASGAGASPGSNGAIGSGVVIDTKHDILTSLHVVAGATSIKVTFANGSSAHAEIVNKVPENDIAVLRPTEDVAGGPPATLGDPHLLQVGSEAFVVGNPFGLYGSLSAGVVSGLDRAFEMPNSAIVLHGLIQVDAAVNPGNSGGPLLDANGLVVGIVAALVNPTPDRVFAGIGLAVPIDIVSQGVGLPPD